MGSAKLSFRAKLVWMLLPALLGLLVCSVILLRDNYSKAVEARNLSVLIKLTERNGDLVHELQKERGLTAGFLASKGEKFSAELGKQRQEVDKEIAEIKTAFGQDSAILELGNLKRDVDGLLAS